MRAMACWDPGARQVRLLACWSSGGIEEILIQRKTKTGFLGTYIVKFLDMETERSRIRIDYPDADSCVFKFVDGSRKGQVLSTWKRAE